MRIDRTGETKTNNFGSEMIITEYKNARNITVFFPKYNYTVQNIEYNNFKKGNVKCPYEPRQCNVGYIGEGLYKAVDENKIKTKYYNIWSKMLQRCYFYNDNNRNYSYKECTVCDEWLNFQNFAKWYEENYYEIPGEKMTIDKDILIKGNKIYSPNTCLIVPERINLLFTKRYNERGKLPIGVRISSKNGKYEARCNVFDGKKSKTKYLGYYNTSEEAFAAYKTFKENQIKQIADKYKDLIPERLYNAMYEYEVEITD